MFKNWNETAIKEVYTVETYILRSCITKAYIVRSWITYGLSTSRELSSTRQCSSLSRESYSFYFRFVEIMTDNGCDYLSVGNTIEVDEEYGGKWEKKRYEAITPDSHD